MTKCYIIKGFTGEYADSSEWNVKVFLDEIKAKVYCEGLNNLLKQLGFHASCEKILDSWDDRDNICSDQVRKFDPKFFCDYTGTYYEISECDFVE